MLDKGFEYDIRKIIADIRQGAAQLLSFNSYPSFGLRAVWEF
jgi:hypothetical protein